MVLVPSFLETSYSIVSNNVLHTFQLGSYIRALALDYLASGYLFTMVDRPNILAFLAYHMAYLSETGHFVSFILLF